LPAPASGTISSMLKKKGDKASVGDVIGYIETNGSRPTPVTSRAGDAPRPAETPRPIEQEPKVLEPRGLTPLTPLPSVPPVRQSGRDEQIVPMTPIRRRIAQRLVEAQKSAALLTTFNQIDMSAVIALRKQHQDAFQSKYRVKLGFMSFFVKASIEALKLIPQVNAEIRGNDIVYRNYYDIGIAVGGGKGLVVPVLRNAERMSFAEVERAIADFAQRANANQLRVDELQGGTFTISNGGIYGSMLSTPIVNPPQSGVLGLHVIEDRPVARDGAVVIRPMMYVALTYDHRIVDGREAVTFLTRIKEVIEEPARLLLEV
jgi:2-oxoglutarate dehydrogenase E2 component (dihydrolipoamide succinyltransferase)